MVKQYRKGNINLRDSNMRYMLFKGELTGHTLACRTLTETADKLQLQ
jgi:hypothetical protein